MIESFLSGLGWCTGAMLALICFILVRPFIYPNDHEEAKDHNRRSLTALNNRNELLAETNQALSRIGDSFEEASSGRELLASVIFESAAFLECGNVDKAKESLQAARQLFFQEQCVIQVNPEKLDEIEDLMRKASNKS